MKQMVFLWGELSPVFLRPCHAGFLVDVLELLTCLLCTIAYRKESDIVDKPCCRDPILAFLLTYLEDLGIVEQEQDRRQRRSLRDADINRPFVRSIAWYY